MAALIPFEDYEALQHDLDDLRAGRRAQAAPDAWESNPALARPYAEVRAGLVTDGLLDG